MTKSPILALLLAVLAAGCGALESETITRTPTTPPTQDVRLPDGVTLTKPGSAVRVGKAATFTIDTGDGVSAVTATITKVTRGKIRDLRFFTLDAASRKYTPYYVSANLQNRGPAGLGGIAPPFTLRNNKGAVAPPITLNGEFKPCAPRTLPATLLPGKSAKVCMVFLQPPGTKIRAVEALSNGLGESVSWEP